MIIVYSRDGCSPCATLKYFLRRKGVPFEERSPDASVRIFPTIEYEGVRIEGLNFPRLNELLAATTTKA